MIWLKILAPIFSIFFGAIQFLISKKWNDKRTKKYHIMRYIVLFMLSISIIITLIIVINDDIETKLLKGDLGKIQTTLDNVTIEERKRDEISQKEHDTLLIRINELQNQLKPFIEIALMKFPKLNTNMALVFLANEIEKQNQRINTIQYYSDVAKLDYNGKTNNYKHPILETTGISELLKPVIKNTDNNVIYSCNSEAYKIYDLIIEKYPTYPFSYYAYAKCLFYNNDEDWEGYAVKCIEILNNTTQISDHKPSHDAALKELLELINNK